MARVVVRMLEGVVSTSLVILMVAMVSTTTLRGDVHQCMSTQLHAMALRCAPCPRPLCLWLRHLHEDVVH